MDRYLVPASPTLAGSTIDEPVASSASLPWSARIGPRGPIRCREPVRRRRPTILLALLLAFAAITGCVPGWPGGSTGPPPPAEDSDRAELRRRAAQADDIAWLADVAPSHPWLRPVRRRSELIRDKYERLAAGDPVGAARASGVLAAEAQVRAIRVLERWAGRIDERTGLLPKGVAASDHHWDYADAGADLYPHLLIAATLYRPDLAPPLRNVIAFERALTSQFGLPPTIDLDDGQPEDDDLEDRMYGGVEYGKDALLPITERLGSGPWLDRLGELARAVDALAPIESRYGRLPSQDGEVNGQVLQILSRLYWSTGDDTYLDLAERIARAYLEQALPSTGGVPTRTWDFARGKSNTDVVQLRDHGNEMVAGLVEFHLIETIRGGPRVALHRTQIRTMLNRLLEIGRTEDGLWKSAIDLQSGKRLKDTLSDNWGYLYAAYLTQAMVEERLPGGDLEIARRYRAAAAQGMAAAAQLELYPWQGNEQDGYADTIESALYLLNGTPSPEAGQWTDRQAGTLFGAQGRDGRVEDRYLDGNFIRTALLYAAWQTRGLRVEPWAPGVMLGASPDGDCLQIALAADQPWHGILIFDAPRHRLHLGLPFNYPRLNAWPEWFTVDARTAYRVDDPAGTVSGVHGGTDLSRGLSLSLTVAGERQLRVCPEGPIRGR